MNDPTHRRHTHCPTTLLSKEPQGDTATVDRSVVPLWFRLWVVPGAFVVLLAGGFGTTWWLENQADADLRQTMLAHASAIARTLAVEEIKALSFSASDKALPEFQRLRSQLQAYAEATRLRSVYSVAARGEHLVFGPESLAELDPFASPPGTTYQKPPPELGEVFRSREARAAGPYTDEYGSFISAFAPVLDSRNGKVLMVVGVDTEISVHRQAVLESRLVPGLFTVALAGILAAGFFLLRVRDRLPEEKHRRLRHAEAALVGVCGLMFTAAATWITHHAELRSHKASFSTLAAARAEGVVDALSEVREQVGSLQRFFTSSERVRRDEYGHFAAPMAWHDYVAGNGWAPKVAASDLGNFENRARREEGIEDFAIFELDAEGKQQPAERRKAFFPLLFVEPLNEIRGAIGFDIGSNPPRRAAMEAAARSGLPTASDLVIRASDRRQPIINVYQPVFADPDQEPKNTARTNSASLRGFVYVSLRPAGLLKYVTATASSTLDLDLFQLESNQPPRLVGSSKAEPNRTPLGKTDLAAGEGRPRFVVHPILIFGRAYALVVRPGPAYLAAHPRRDAWVPAGAGLLISALLSAFTAVTTQRRAALERTVRERTAALWESQERLKHLIRAAQDAIIMIDPQGRISLWNESAVRIFGYTAEEALGQNLHQILTPAGFHTAHERGFAEYQRAGTGAALGRTLELAAVRKDGTEFPVELSLAPVRLGGAWHAVGILRDITVRKQTETALRRSEERFAQITAQSRELIWETDAQGLYTYVSQACTALLGYAEDEIVGKLHFCDLHPEEGREVFRAAAFKVIEQRLLFTDLHCPVVRKDGRVIDMLTNGAPVLDEQGTLLGYRGSDKDITWIKRAEADIRRERQRLEEVIQGTNVGTWEWNIVSGETVFNERWAGMIGYALEELAPTSIRAWTSRCHPEDLKTSESLLQRHFAGELDHYDCECRMKHKNGSWVWVHDRGRVVEWSPDGKPLRMSGTHADITERKQAEAELRKLSRAVEHSPASIVISDQQGNIEYVNPKFCEVTGYAFDEVRGQNPRILKSGGNPPEVYQQLWSTITSGREWRGELRNRKKSGEIFWEYASISPIRAADGQVTHFVAVKEDITERKRSEQALMLAADRVRLAAKAGRVGIWEMDMATGRLEWDDQMYQFYGLDRTAGGVDYSRWCDCVHADDIERVERELRDTLSESGLSFDTEFRIVRTDGKMRVIRATATVVRDASRTPLRVIGTNWDVTEDRIKAKKLQETNN